MISVEEAKNIILNNTSVLGIQNIKVEDALNRTISEDVYATIDIPMFDQAAMDGYGISHDTFIKGGGIFTAKEIAAGADSNDQFSEGEAIRIFTGAKIPEGIDTVIIQEDVSIANNEILLHSNSIIKGANVRKKGSQIKKGECAIPKGTRLTPPLIGFLTSLGIKEINVFAIPGVNIIITGNELISVNDNLEGSKVFESNGITLKSALQMMGIKDIYIHHCGDNKEALCEILMKVIKTSNIIIITGGISVGKYDYTHSALEQINATELIYKVKQKPGKPMYVGKKGDVLVFGLPGNPAAVVSCFYNYVYPAIKSVCGEKITSLKSVRLPLLDSFSKKQGLANFLKASIHNNQLKIHNGQESNILNTFLDADGLVYLSEEKEQVQAGEIAEIILFPNT
ncbi:MAG: molybdopterin molybdotransferase MoeA [Bacteroidia bacterium]|nr:molybdopterin molybdotransferase MoeA [Bacteroidia bacterium]